MLQESVDSSVSIIPVNHQQLKQNANRPLKSLSDSLKGKQGTFSSEPT